MSGELKKGCFTLPGEAGYEHLTLKMADKWGADVIRDSDGTVLSDEILNAGYQIYSTICIIRDHNTWAKANPSKQQQCILSTQPYVAEGNTLSIPIMQDFFAEQFSVNASAEAMKYWQVIDRTIEEEVEKENWSYLSDTQEIKIKNIVPWHKYSVNFFVYRIWEEISMYNHTTNHWEKEHLMQIDPMYQETREYLKKWMKDWCESHPQSNVVRFTSMFYNFAWIWGSSEKNRHLFSDWASYDFTVSPYAMDLFEKEYGYSLKAEDFANQGKYHVTHMPGTKEKADWMEFINRFVVNFGKELVEIVHQYDKKAYVFYDDSWVGIEPYGKEFSNFGFDGLIKCVFSGFEARLCSGVDVATHELRLHPYLFPVGLGGAPTFMEGGDPTLEAKKYWNSIRRALLRQPVERIGLGGYLHLVEDYPDFCDYIEKVANEFREIKDLHANGAPYACRPVVAVLHSWGSIRSWSLSGHFHETYMHDLIHINEALSGLPFNVRFINFDDVKNGVLSECDVIINAGIAGTAWSGGSAWEDAEIIEKITAWTSEGGVFIGVNQPSACHGYDTYYRMAHVLGVDEDLGDRVSHGKWKFETKQVREIPLDGCSIKVKNNRYLYHEDAVVLTEMNGIPGLTINPYKKGYGVYLPSFEVSLSTTRMLMDIILYCTGNGNQAEYITDNNRMECAYYPVSRMLVVINNSDTIQKTSIHTMVGVVTTEVESYDTKFILLDKEFKLQ